MTSLLRLVNTYTVVEPLAVHDGGVPDGGAAELLGAHISADGKIDMFYSFLISIILLA